MNTEPISKEKLKAFQSFIDELKNSIEPYTKQRILVLTNKQVLSLVLNIPFILGIIADGKKTLSENIRRVLLDAELGVHPADFPALLDDLKDPVNSLSDKDYEDNYLGEEKFLLENFVKYEDMLTSTLQLYCAKTNYIDKYEILNKISKVTSVDLRDEANRNRTEWQFLKKLGITVNHFNKQDYTLTEEEWEKIFSLSYLAFYLVSAADQKISGKEKKEFKKFTEANSRNINPLTAYIFQNSKLVFDNKPKDFAIGRHKDVLDEFQQALAVLDQKFAYYEAHEVKRLLLKLCYSVASSAGFAGFAYVDYKESVQIAEIAAVLGLNKLNGKTIKFRNKIKAGLKQVSAEVLYKRFYLSHLINAIIQKM